MNGKIYLALAYKSKTHFSLHLSINLYYIGKLSFVGESMLLYCMLQLHQYEQHEHIPWWMSTNQGHIHTQLTGYHKYVRATTCNGFLKRYKLKVQHQMSFHSFLLIEAKITKNWPFLECRILVYGVFLLRFFLYTLPRVSAPKFIVF